MDSKTLVIVGATGSIGRSTLDVVRQYPQRFRVECLAAGSDTRALAAAAAEFHPSCVGIADANRTAELRAQLDSCGASAVRILSGDNEICAYLRSAPARVCLSAACGSRGLAATVAAVEAGMEVALANKESLVAAGAYLLPLAARTGARLLPVDSEHSALFQCLQGADSRTVRRLTITASGGAFRDFTAQELAVATPRQALAHPTWSMGPKITVDSATLANKALEVIEAHWLFGVGYDKIEVLVHRQSVVHGMVEYCDGTVLAQLAPADMRLPILYALTWPERLETGFPGLSLARLGELTFSEPDHVRFPMLQLGIAAGRQGGLAPAVYSAANEAAVEMFLAGQIPFPEITKRVEAALARVPVTEVNPQTVDESSLEARSMVLAG